MGSGQTIQISGDLTAGQTDCSLSVDVVATAVGAFANGADNLAVVGLNEPAQPAILTVVATTILPLPPNTGAGATVGYAAPVVLAVAMFATVALWRKRASRN